MVLTPDVVHQLLLSTYSYNACLTAKKQLPQFLAVSTPQCFAQCDHITDVIGCMEYDNDDDNNDDEIDDQSMMT